MGAYLVISLWSISRIGIAVSKGKVRALFWTWFYQFCFPLLGFPSPVFVSSDTQTPFSRIRCRFLVAPPPRQELQIESAYLAYSMAWKQESQAPPTHLMWLGTLYVKNVLGFVLFLVLINLFIYFWLCWVSVAARGLSLVVVSGGYSSLWCVGFSLWWLLLLRSTGSRHGLQ